MSDAVLMLRLEHSHQAKLLEILDNKVERLERGEAVDLELLASIIDYFQSYDSTCHRAKENLVFQALRRRDPAAADSVSHLMEEHEDLTRATDDLTRLILEARQGADIPTVRLASELQHFRDFYRRHMEMEEKHFLPVALQVLSEEDWEEVDFDLFDRENPLFSDKVEARFEKLRERLIAQA